MIKYKNIFKYLIAFIALYVNLYSIDSPRASVIRTDNGFIDYANRVIVSRGTADIIKRNNSDNEFQIIEKNLKFSKSEARAYARENLLDLIKIVNFDSKIDIFSLVFGCFQLGLISYKGNKTKFLVCMRECGTVIFKLLLFNDNDFPL